MITCLSLQHAYQLYKNGKLDRIILDAICQGYMEGEIVPGGISEEVLEQIVATRCKTEDLLLSFTGGNLYIAESVSDIRDFAIEMLGAGYTSVEHEINLADFAFLCKDAKEVCAFYATNNSGGPTLVASEKDWAEAGGSVTYVD